MTDIFQQRGQECLDEFHWGHLKLALHACELAGSGPSEQDRLEILRRMKTLKDRLNG